MEISLQDGVDAKKFMERLNYPRPFGTRAEYTAAEELERAARLSADAVTIEPFSVIIERNKEGEKKTRSVSSQNVHAVLNGTGTDTGFLVLSAHYDSVPEGPGAYDNLSSCAVMLALLQYFHSHRPKRTIHFVFFGGEEAGLLGSQAFVRRHNKLLASCILNCNSDLAGQDGGQDVIGITAGSDACRMAEKALMENGLKACIKQQIWSSDSNSFAAAGIPAMTYDRDGYGMHTSEDTLDRITPQALADAMQIIGSIAEKAAQEESPSYQRAVPEKMQRGLNEYFHKKNEGVSFVEV